MTRFRPKASSASLIAADFAELSFFGVEDWTGRVLIHDYHLTSEASWEGDIDDEMASYSLRLYQAREAVFGSCC